MSQRTDHADFEFVTISCRVFGKHAKMVHAAAEKAGDKSAAEYMRRVVLDWAASDMGVPAPTYERSERPSVTIAEAARARGMTTREFQAYAARELAVRDRESQRPPAPAEPRAVKEALGHNRPASGLRRRSA